MPSDNSTPGRPIVVVTGASAGVGRATAVAFARRGWNVALIARGEKGLDDTAREVRAMGVDALTLTADMADAARVFAAADQVVERWAAIDVWINNAMVTVFSPLAELSPDEFRRVTEVTYLGYVHGTMAALRHMRLRGGTIVQVGSALSYRAIPLQSAYCGAKFAIRGFTDALRCELKHDKSSVRLTMVQLPAVNTPQFDWARNKLPRRPQPVPPVQQPEPVAEAIFRAALRAPREVWIGLSSLRAIVGTTVAPTLLDRVLAHAGYEGQMSRNSPSADRCDNLFAPAPDGHATHGRFDRQARRVVLTVRPSSLTLAAAVWFLLLVAGVVFGLAA